MFGRALLLVLLLWGQDTVRSVRLLELRIPVNAREGDSALLGCQYDLEGEELYSVKWYKDNEEFYRYVPKNHPPIIAYKRAGVNVNMTRSSNTIVVLENLSRESEGEYACEVSGEAPGFNTTKQAKNITVHLLPESGPHVTGLQEIYYLDDPAVINCTSWASRPKADLNWLVNGQQAAKADLRGPWQRKSKQRPDAIETTLQLRFKVEPRHFVNSAMRLKCQATIPPLYQRETNSTHYIGLPFTKIENGAHFQTSASADQTADSSPKQSTSILFSFTALLLLVLQTV